MSGGKNMSLGKLVQESDQKPKFKAKRLIPVGEDMPKFPTDDTEDIDDIQESEHFNSRQSFLNLCQGNHYQFDQLRRAKHTSMMVLYHLHNPDVPKFVPSCHICHVDILTGVRYHCEQCEQDFCQNCYGQNNGKVHNHPLRPISVQSSAPLQLTEEQRKERQRSIQLHMQLLQHSANCIECKVTDKTSYHMHTYTQSASYPLLPTPYSIRLTTLTSFILLYHSIHRVRTV